jgi:two-component system, sensor histidine kinase PdtaS
MSTLGDLLAEHTVLPGSAVDHLHTVVGSCSPTFRSPII